jgi:hypothetical protein
MMALPEHGVGGRADLPVPLPTALAAAVAVLIFTFVMISDAWPKPRLGPGRPLPRVVSRLADATVTRWTLRAAGLAAAGWFVLALVRGGPADSAFYVLLWVGIPLLSLCCGPVWRLVNPLRTLHLLLTSVLRRDGYRPYPPRLGHWPAAALLFAYIWLELVAAHKTSSLVIGAYLGGYALIVLAGAVIYGDGWFDHADGFEVYATLAARLAPIGRSPDGRLVIRTPLAGLAATPIGPGMIAVVLVLLGATAYDGLSTMPLWDRALDSTWISPTLLGTLGLTASVGIVAGVYATATASAGRIAGQRPQAAAFAPGIMPIALGYVVAHYLSLLLLHGQRVLMPHAHPVALTPAALSDIQVICILAGHVTATLAAHATATRLFTRRPAASQIPLLLLMIGYTLAGLTLLLTA